jgi:hypothetical protein
VVLGIIEEMTPAVEYPETGKTYSLKILIREVIRGTLKKTVLECLHTPTRSRNPLPLGHPIVVALSTTNGACRLDGIWRPAIRDRL